ncbi:MAG: polyprenyl diphosphate synthase [Dehalococcoidia bacterium]|nr:polyprenyl diphosphate synthase [Dehalococcoidia bacterium]
MAETTPFPNHIAIIMDGNGRWATRRGLSRLEGHLAGFNTIHDIVRHLGEISKIKYATFYAFSTENWNRPEAEVKGIFNILSESISSEALELHENNVRIRWLGRAERLPPKLVQDIRKAEDLTADNSGMTIALAFNYGGRQELADAMRRIAAESIPLDRIDEKLIANYLYTSDMPDVDLLIRTADELRISNFLLWQTAYAEFYFTPVLWPDFNRAELDKALESYRARKRRFGGL